MRSILRNRTGIEDWILEKAHHRRLELKNEEKFVYPYDLGKWENLKQVLTLSGQPVGNGTDWPVKEGCNQYTITVCFFLFKCTAIQIIKQI